MKANSLNAHLSNYEIRAYKRKNGAISFHFSTVLLIDFGWDFCPSYIKDIKGSFTLVDNSRVDFDCCSYSLDNEFDFDGRFATISLKFENKSSEMKLVVQQPILIELYMLFDFPDGVKNIEHSQYGVLKNKYFGP